MADKTTNLQLQKIDNTDYAGNFPTIYNNNLDLIDGLKSDLITSVAGKQDKLVAGSGITIASDGKTISSSGKEWKLYTGELNDLIIEDSSFYTLKPIKIEYYRLASGGNGLLQIICSSSEFQTIKISHNLVNYIRFYSPFMVSSDENPIGCIYIQIMKNQYGPPSFSVTYSRATGSIYRLTEENISNFKYDAWGDKIYDYYIVYTLE